MLRGYVSELGLLASVMVSSLAGSAVGFATGLVPGLHVNNLAAATVAYAGAALSMSAALGTSLGSAEQGLSISCFLVSALVSHAFSEAVPNTYVGIPSGDVVAVLPAHRLARAGLGWTAVKASVDGSLAGVLLGMASLVPVSILLGPSIGLYGLAKGVMGFLVLALSAALVLSDGLSVPASRHRMRARLARTARIVCVFAAAGLLGALVLDSDFYACALPLCSQPFVPRSSLLLPLFAGLFGLPTLLLGLRSSGAGGPAFRCACKVGASGTARGTALSLLGGVLVGWVPGLTSGSSATLCASAVRQPSEEANDADGARRFIWLCSAISTAGAVLSVGALFTILRARSGVMDAVAGFIHPEPVGAGLPDMLAPASLLLSMVLSAVLSHAAVSCARRRLGSAGRVMCSKGLAAAAMVFVCALVAALTGPRGLLLLAAAVPLGLLPPLMGVRRIHLMGCLMVPVSAMFLL